MTKKALASALKRLLEHKTLDKITVSDLTDLCGLNRQTFYYHFKDIYDLLEWIYREDTPRVIPELDEGAHGLPSQIKDIHKKWVSYYLNIFRYIQENRALIMNTYHSSQKELLMNYVRNEAFLLVRMVVDVYAEGIHVQDEDKNFLARFYQYALMDVVLEWMETGMKEDPESIVRKTEIIMNGTLHEALLRLGHGR